MIPRNGIEEPRKSIHVRVCVYVRMYVGRGTGWWRDTEKRRETRTRRENLDILEAMALFGASRATLSRSNPPPPFPRPTNLPYTTLRLPFSLVESNYTRQDPPAREGDTVKLLRGTERRGSVVPLPLSSPRAVQEGQADSRRG